MDYFREAVHEEEGERAWVTYIKAKVTEQNQSFPTLVVGQTGSGKSWSTLRLCEEIEPDFQLEGNWFFRARDFYRAFNKYYKDKANKKRGKIWVLDEAGVDFSSDEWQSKTNKIFAKVFSTARFRNYIFFGTVPFTDFISKKIRKLMQYHFVANYTQEIDGKLRGVIVPRCLQWSEKKDDFYYHKLIKITKEGSETAINRLLMKKPSKKLREEYERRREEFSDSLDKELLSQLEQMDQTKEEIARGEPLKPSYNAYLNFFKEGLSYKDMVEKSGRTRSELEKAQKGLKKLGYGFAITEKRHELYDPIKKDWITFPRKHQRKPNKNLDQIAKFIEKEKKMREIENSEKEKV